MLEHNVGKTAGELLRARLREHPSPLSWRWYAGAYLTCQQSRQRCALTSI